LESSAPSSMPTFTPTVSPFSFTDVEVATTCLFVNLYFDKHSEDTSWIIKDTDGGIVMDQSLAYDAGLTTVSPQVCLPEGNYEFTIYDAYEDGMCCKWGDGVYNVTSTSGDIIVMGGTFGSDETTNFTMPFDPADSLSVPSTPTDIFDDESLSPTNRPTVSPTPLPTTVIPTPSPTPLPTVPPTLNPTVPPTPPPTLNPTVPPSPQPTASPMQNPTKEDLPGPTDSCYFLDVNVTLDQYPSDTRWEIIPKGETTALFVSPPYDNSLIFLPDTQSVCLKGGNYDFIIYDVYGDGICCDWGEGSYQLAFDGEVVVNGGSFGLSETKPFTTPGFDNSVTTDPPVPSPTTDPPDTSPSDCHNLFINLNFDQYPVDTSWDISQGGVIVETSPSYDGATQVTEELCLLPGDYVFTIYDVYQDGMCCKWGEGNYTITTDVQVVIKEGAEFGASESTSITLPI